MRIITKDKGWSYGMNNAGFIRELEKSLWAFEEVVRRDVLLDMGLEGVWEEMEEHKGNLVFLFFRRRPRPTSGPHTGINPRTPFFL